MKERNRSEKETDSTDEAPRTLHQDRNSIIVRDQKSGEVRITTINRHNARKIAESLRRQSSYDTGFDEIL